MTVDRSEPTWASLHDPDSVRVWREVLRPVGAELKTSAQALADAIVSRLRTDLEAVFIDAQTLDESRVSTEESLRLLGQIIETGSDPSTNGVPPSTLALVRSSVWRHIPLSFQSRFYRLGQREVWRWLHSRILATTSHEPDRATAVDLTTMLLMEFVDSATTRADEAYEREKETWHQGATASRAAAVEDVLAERVDDIEATSARLRYELRRHHCGIIAWIEPGSSTSTSLSALNGVVAEIARANGSDATLTHPMGSLAVAGWFSRRQELDAEIELPRGHDGAFALPPGIRLAVGRPGRGIDGFRLTHIEAGHARTVAAATSSSLETVTRYSDVAVLALCLADPGHARRFATRVLGPLLADGPMSHLITTLAAFLATDRSPARTAEVLQVHPNTVTYRIRQVEAILGRAVDADSLELRVALTVLPAVAGSAVSRAGAS